MQIYADYRALHQIPELHRDLPKTMAYLAGALKDLPRCLTLPCQDSLLAWFDFGQDHAIAFRADADALPITEKTGLPHASTHPGQMHACGHDGHMSILLEVARRLSQKESFPHNVLLVFQCAEETTGGALDLCKAGIFTSYGVKTIFGLHIWPELTAGEMFSRKNELMSRSCVLTVDVYGRSSHIAKPEAGIDALRAGAAFYTRLQQLEASLPSEIFRVLNFGKFQSGTVGNAISAHTHMEGTLRAFQDDIFESLRDGILSIGRQVEEETGCTVSIHMSEGYPAVMNPESVYTKAKQAAPFLDLDRPTMTSEDFSWYQRYLPGMFFFLGAGNVPALHSSDFSFDPAILPKGADFFMKLAENYDPSEP